MKQLRNVEYLLIIIIFILCYISTYNNALSQTISPLMISTRDFFDNKTGEEIRDINEAFEDVSSIVGINEKKCPGELVIYIHGVWATPNDAENQTQIVFLSIQDRDYKIPVVGYSWNSDTKFSLDDDISKEGWNIAKIIANKNGPLLAKFILGYKNICPEDEIRLIAHSLGSRVTLSALQSLHNDNIRQIIESIHLLGAAVDDEQISLNSKDCVKNIPKLECSGNAINSTTKLFFNLYNREDNMLTPFYSGSDGPSPYKNSENDSALGGFGKQNGISYPTNYFDIDVQNYIPSRFDVDYEDADGDGKCDLPAQTIIGNICLISMKGDNHMGYLGFRDANNGKIVDSGAIGVVVDNWKMVR